MACSSELLSILESVPIQDLLSTIMKKAKTGNKDVVPYIRAIFQGSSNQTDVSENLRFQTFKCALSVLTLKDLPSSTASELLLLLLLKLDLFQTSNLVELAQVFVDHAKNSDKFESKWLEVFSKVLSCLAHRADTIVYQGKDMSGSELRKNILSSLFSDDSGTSCLVQIASALKDVDLSESEVNLITERLLDILPTVEFIDLPPFIYQLILISTKGKCTRHVIQSIMSHFIEKDKQMKNLLHENPDSENVIDSQEHVQYRQTEGTVILMISVICRHDQNIGKEYLFLLKKILYKSQLILSPFIFLTALSLSKIHRNSDEIFDTLKKSLVAAFQLKEKRRNSFWFRNVIKGDEDVLKVVKDAIKCSKFGWDHVCQGLVKFGFIVLDAFGPRYIVGNSIKAACPEACDLGNHIIRDTFKAHPLVRQEVFEKILNTIITKSQKPVSHYIDILSQIVQSDPLFLLDVLPKLVETLDYLHFLPHSNAENILQSLAPLLKISAPLKDTLMLVLRKALFHRDVEARKVAVCGYLTLLKKINFIGKVSLSQSQTSIGSHPSSCSMISTQIKADVYVSSSTTSKTMCLEIMGLLKRALMQQNEVRKLLYIGLYDVVLHNQSFKDIVLELLLGQFEKFYNADESDIPLHFALCFQDDPKNCLILKEPLAHLITSIYLVLFVGSNETINEDYNQSAQKILDTFLQNLMKRMLDVDATDFQISKNIDVDESLVELNQKTNLLLNIYESLVEYSFMLNPDFDIGSCEDFIKLYHKYKQVFDSTSKKKQTKISKSKLPVYQLFSHGTLNFISKAMDALFVDEVFRHQEGLQLLRADSYFAVQLVTACNQKFTKMCESSKMCDGFSQVLKSPFNCIILIGKVLLKSYCDGLNSDFSALQQEKLSTLLAEGLSTIFNYVSLAQQKNMSKFITSICNEDCLSTTDALQYILKNIQKSIMKLLSDTEDDSHLKECISLLSVIKVLYSSFMSDFKDGSIYKWLKQLCSQQVFRSVAVSKPFISLCFSLGHQDQDVLGLLKEFAFDIRYQLGNIDPDESVSGTPKNEIVTTENSQNILLILFSNVEQVFDELDWVLNYMKINTLGGNDSFESSQSLCRLTVEQSICSRVSDLIQIFYEVVQTGVSDHMSNTVLKLVTRLYKILTTLTKYYLQLHKNKISQLYPAFEKLAKLSNAKLTTQVYAFITFIQMLSGDVSDKKKKAKGNAGSFKAVQDLKTIPSLVFEIESFEKNLIILSKKYKKDLTNKMKLSTARDFRINANVVTNILEQQEKDSIADTTVEDNNSVPNSPENIPAPNSPEKNDLSHMPIVHKNSGDEASKDANEPVNVSQNIFGDNIPDNAVPVLPKVGPSNVKRKCLGIRMNAKRKL